MFRLNFKQMSIKYEYTGTINILLPFSYTVYAKPSVEIIKN